MLHQAQEKTVRPLPGWEWRSDWQNISAEADRRDLNAEDSAYAIGKRDGFSDAVQGIDMLTGGDGEYTYSTLPGRGCPEPDDMIARIVARVDEARHAALREAASIAIAHDDHSGAFIAKRILEAGGLA